MAHAPAQPKPPVTHQVIWAACEGGVVDLGWWVVYQIVPIFWRVHRNEIGEEIATGICRDGFHDLSVYWSSLGCTICFTTSDEDSKREMFHEMFHDTFVH